MNNPSLSDQFKALGNDTRLEILHFLSTGEKCVCHIFEHLNLAQNLVSHHLGVLRKAGLITSRREGKWVHYSLNIRSLQKLNGLFAKLFVSNPLNKNC